ncbi:hypothetical protein DL768_004855 [Monosporascus sp. mg162]|nr:hypothetical protein DL768_004855 [Monosporascus sp. mg162]
MLQSLPNGDRRSEQCKNEVESPYRENDFVVQRLFAASEKRGQSASPGRFWLKDLLYLLETSHEELLADAEETDGASSTFTYKHFIDSYALQIWKAAAGYEFFLNKHLVDFEGDTEFCLGAEVRRAGFQLIWITRKDMAHLVLPISPEVAVVFWDESRCWQSPFADSMRQPNIPYPENSLLWTRCTRICHADSFVIVRRSPRFGRAKKESDIFLGREETWKSSGTRLGYRQDRGQRRDGLAPPTPAQATRIVDGYMVSLSEVTTIVGTTREPIPRTKEVTFKSRQVILALDIVGGPATPSPVSDGRSIVDSGLRAAFESAYPPKHPDHKGLVAIDFFQFFSDAIEKSTFAQLSLQIDDKISDLVQADSFETHFEAAKKSVQSPTESSFWQGDNHHSEKSSGHEEMFENPAFRSNFKAVQGFGVRKWMFEERQDILATFIRQVSEPI